MDAKLWFVESHGSGQRSWVGAYYLVIASSEQEAIRISKMGLEDHTLRWCAAEIDMELLGVEPWHITNDVSTGIFYPSTRHQSEYE